jgi:hypothetical protein
MAALGNSEKVINFTPHAINYFANPQASVVETFQPSGATARITKEEQKWIRDLLTTSGKSIPVFTPPQFGKVESLPPEMQQQTVLVNMLTAQALRHNGWTGRVLTPDTGPNAVVRTSTGEIIGTTRFVQYN